MRYVGNQRVAFLRVSFDAVDEFSNSSGQLFNASEFRIFELLVVPVVGEHRTTDTDVRFLVYDLSTDEDSPLLLEGQLR